MIKIADISHHQKKVDFSKLKSADISAVIIRAGYSTTLDSCFEYNVKECQRLNIPYALYWYSYAIDDSECIKEVQAFLEAVKNVGAVGVPLFLEMEDADGKKASKALSAGKTWNNKLIYDCTACFLSELSFGYGYCIGLYASQSYYKDLDLMERQSICADIDIIRWVARWSTDAPKVLCDIWQYTNSYKWSGAESGIVDMSYITEQMYYKLFRPDKLSGDKETEKKLSDYTVREMIDEIMTR